jgi:hypothetical protein
MIAWTSKFPWHEKPLGYFRLLRARHRYFDRIGWRRGGVGHVLGDQQRLVSLRDKHKGQRAFIIANGPSLKDLDLSPLKDEVTIACNGIYKLFPEWGWQPNYFMMEDIDQVELRRRDIPGVRGPLKMFALYNSYAFPADADTVFFNAPRVRGNLYYWTDEYPQFSRDFAAVAHLGATVTYLMLQWAYHLGCNPVYIVGLDHDYGDLPKLFDPQHITITKEHLEKVRGLHFDDDYYKEGDPIGVPDVRRQEAAYALSRQTFEQEGRSIYNASARTRLNVFERVDFSTLFHGNP